MLVDELLSNKDVANIFSSEKSTLINKFTEFMVHLLQNLRNKEDLVSILHKQGKHRASKGATKEIYEKISHSILNCIEKVMGLILFDNKTKEAWKAVFDFVIHTMLEASPTTEEKIESKQEEVKEETTEEIEDKCIDYEFLNKQVSELLMRLFSVKKKKISKNINFINFFSTERTQRFDQRSKIHVEKI
jgi:hemoglobin-like flavoprotein